MKQTDDTKIVTGEGASHSRKRRLLIWGVPLAVIVIVVAGFGAWQFMHREKPLTPQQQGAKNSLSDQQQYIQQETQANAPDEVKAVSYSNLAESYAVAGQCKEANDALQQARKLAPADMQKDIKDTANTVGDHC